MSLVDTIEQLETIYGQPSESALLKVSKRLTAEYRTLIEASPFLALATCGPEGIDCSPRGDRPGFVRVVDDTTLHLPDRNGNNRVDSLRNIVRDSRVALLFLLPGNGMTLRVNGRAQISVDPDLLGSFEIEGKTPRTVLTVAIDKVFFQCSRAVIRSGLWDPERFVDPASLPSPGNILSSLSENRIDGDAYDREWPDRAKRSLW